MSPQLPFNEAVAGTVDHLRDAGLIAFDHGVVEEPGNPARRLHHP